MISISLATLAMQCAGEAKTKYRENKRERSLCQISPDISTKGTVISVPSVEVNISLQDISMDGMGILYYIVKLNVLHHMSFSVSYSLKIICITPPPPASTSYWVRNLAEPFFAFIFAVLKPLRRRETLQNNTVSQSCFYQPWTGCALFCSFEWLSRQGRS